MPKFVKGDPRASECGKKSKRTQSLSTLLEKYGNAKIKGSNLTYKEQIVLNLITMAADKENKYALAYIKEFFDRDEGKAINRIDADINNNYSDDKIRELEEAFKKAQDADK